MNKATKNTLCAGILSLAAASAMGSTIAEGLTENHEYTKEPQMSEYDIEDWSKYSEFEIRMKMIMALEETHDDMLLNSLVKADIFLESYGIVLRRACTHLKDPYLVEKLLDLPVLDKNSDNYKQTIGELFSTIASSDKSPDPMVVDILFERIKDDQEVKDASLRSIFSAIAAGNFRSPNIEMARMLVNAGAAPNKAALSSKQSLESQKAEIQKRLDKIDKLIKDTSGPIP
jgi:hypothetical protein